MSGVFDLVIGLGITGESCVRYLREQQSVPVRVLDTRSNPPGLANLKTEAPEVPVHVGGWQNNWLAQARRLIVSPGVALANPEIAKQIAARSEEHTSELQSRGHLVCRLLLEKKKRTKRKTVARPTR